MAVKGQQNKNKGKNYKKFLARVAAVQAIYEHSQNQRPLKNLLEEYLTKTIEIHVQDLEESVETTQDRDGALLKNILLGISEREEDIHAIIKSHLNQEDIEPLLASILFSGAYELLAHSKIDAPIILNDYVDITHSFYGASEAGLVNAVLDKCSKSLR